MRTRVTSTQWLVALTLAALVTAPSTRTGISQAQQTQQVMRQKLVHSERLLAALVTSRWPELEMQGRALEAVTRQPGWDVMRLPEYAKFTGAFQKATLAVVDAAGQRDQRVALAAYNGLVASCVECHRYVARARIAAEPLQPGGSEGPPLPNENAKRE